MKKGDIFEFSTLYTSEAYKWDNVEDLNFFFTAHNDQTCIQVVLERIKKLQTELNNLFLNRKSVIDMLIFSAISDIHIVLLGDPGTGKTLLIRSFCKLMGLDPQKDLFDFMLTPTTTPVQLFGPPDIKELEQGKLKYNTDMYLPDRPVVFLDEIFKVNSAVGNSLLSILNEGIFFNGNYGPQKCKMFMFFSAANEIPTDPELEAFVDRISMIVETEEIGMDMENPDIRRETIELLRKGYNLKKPINRVTCLNDFMLFSRFVNMIPDDELLGADNNSKTAKLYNALLALGYNQWAEKLSDRNKVKLWKAFKAAIYFNIADDFRRSNYNINDNFSLLKSCREELADHLAIILSGFFNRAHKRSTVDMKALTGEISSEILRLA